MRLFLIWLLLIFPICSSAQKRIVNVYAWTGEVPDFIVRQFENETGINVNISTYENNEIMYSKVRASQNSGYDVVMPSSYFVDRMRKLNMLEKLDKSKLSNWKNLDPTFLNPEYDRGTQYSVPFLWGITGIFVNRDYYDPTSINKWSDFWDARFVNQLMLLDDYREVFSMALLALGYPANDQNPQHIAAAFQQLKNLMQNVKVFTTETVVSIMIDEDATVGMAWNGDVNKATGENKQIQFIYPKDGFVVWVDNFAIPKNAPHKDTAYEFINFILRADVAKNISLYTKFATVNAAAQKLLPENIRHNPTIYPPKEIMARGQFQLDLDPATLALYEKYWEQLKMIG